LAADANDGEQAARSIRDRPASGILDVGRFLVVAWPKMV